MSIFMKFGMKRLTFDRLRILFVTFSQPAMCRYLPRPRTHVVVFPFGRALAGEPFIMQLSYLLQAVIIHYLFSLFH